MVVEPGGGEGMQRSTQNGVAGCQRVVEGQRKPGNCSFFFTSPFPHPPLSFVCCFLWLDSSPAFAASFPVHWLPALKAATFFFLLSFSFSLFFSSFFAAHLTSRGVMGCDVLQTHSGLDCVLPGCLHLPLLCLVNRQQANRAGAMPRRAICGRPEAS